MPEFDSVVCILAACNEESHIANVVRQMHRAGLRRCVLVANGCRDGTVSTAREVCQRLAMELWVLNVPVALGPDVARAAGALAARRKWPTVHWLLFLDGDLQGSFGPMLQSFIREGHDASCDVQWPSAHELRGTDVLLWRSVLHEVRPELASIAPAQVPLLVNARTLETVSAIWLYHPGIWFATCATAGERFRLRAAVGWHPKFAGNPTRGAEHARQMRETLVGDALDGCEILLHRRFHRKWNGHFYGGLHGLRRLDWLLSFAART